MNCEPLSVTKVSVTPKQINKVDSLWIVSEAVQFGILYTSGHFENAFTVTRNILPWIGPVKSA